MKQAYISIDQRIKVFNSVRDIPYYIAIGAEQDYCCSTKATILQKLLHSLGIQSRPIVCVFNWSDSRIPLEILKLFREKDEKHAYLEVKIPETGKWVKIDPTWDIKLDKIFPIAQWDGLHATVLAVKSIKTYSAQESQKLLLEEGNEIKEEIEKFMIRNKEFYIQLNKWLGENRQSS